MLNNLVNNTGMSSSYNINMLNCICSDVNELRECYQQVQCQSDTNSCNIADLSQYINTENGNITACEVIADSASINSVMSSGIITSDLAADCVRSNTVDATCITGTKGNISALESSTICVNNLYGLTNLEASNLTSGSITASNSISTDALTSNTFSSNNITTGCVVTDSLAADSGCLDNGTITNLASDTAKIENAVVGNLETRCFISDEIATSKINSTVLEVPKLEANGGITGKGTLDLTSDIWKVISFPVRSGIIHFENDDDNSKWSVTVTNGREFVWEDETKEHLKYFTVEDDTVSIAVANTGITYYNYVSVKEEPIFSLSENTGTAPGNDHTYVIDGSGIPKGTVYVYKDATFTDQGVTILGKLTASNLQITCGCNMESIGVDCLYIGKCLTNKDMECPFIMDIATYGLCVTNCECLPVCICSSDSVITGNLYTECQIADCINVQEITGDCIKYDKLQAYQKTDNSSIEVALYDTDNQQLCYSSDLSYCQNILKTPNLEVDCVIGVNGTTTVIGNLDIEGNVYQRGTSYCTHAEDIYTCSDTITLREGAEIPGSGSISVTKYNGVNDGIIELGRDGTLRIGDKNNCQPVLTRSEVSDLHHSNVLIWDACNLCAKTYDLNVECIGTCEYIHCVGTECKTASCDYATSIADICSNYAALCSCVFATNCTGVMSVSCTTDACTYADNVAIVRSNAACIFASACGHNIGTACKNDACSFTVYCVGQITPDTSRFAYCYGNSQNCVLNACFANGTNCFDRYCLNYYTADVDLPVLLTNASTTSTSVTAQEGRSTNALLMFNPSRGVLRACCFTSDNTAYMSVCWNNELNFYSVSDSYVWLNYRGGTSEVRIGNGAANSGFGTLCANTICTLTTLAVRNANGGFRLGAYCLYIS